MPTVMKVRTPERSCCWSLAQSTQERDLGCSKQCCECHVRWIVNASMTSRSREQQQRSGVRTREEERATTTRRRRSGRNFVIRHSSLFTPSSCCRRVVVVGVSIVAPYLQMDDDEDDVELCNSQGLHTAAAAVRVDTPAGRNRRR